MTANSLHITKVKTLKLISIVLKPTPKLPPLHSSKPFYTLITSSRIPGWVPGKDGSRNRLPCPFDASLVLGTGCKARQCHLAFLSHQYLVSTEGCCFLFKALCLCGSCVTGSEDNGTEVFLCPSPTCKESPVAIIAAVALLMQKLP